MAESTDRDLFRSYLRSLRWQVPLAVVAVVAVWAFDVDGIREHGLGPLLLIGVGLFVAVSPLIHLRYEFTWRRDTRLARWLALSIVWMAAWTVLVFVLVGVVIAE